MQRVRAEEPPRFGMSQILLPVKNHHGLECRKSYYQSTSRFRRKFTGSQAQGRITSSWRFLRNDASLIYGHLLRKTIHDSAFGSSVLKCACLLPRVYLCAQVTFRSSRNESGRPAAGTLPLANPPIPSRRTRKLHDRAGRCGLTR